MCALPRKSYFIIIFTSTSLKMKFFIKDFFSKCDQMVSVQERGNQFRFKLLVFKERNVHIYTTILCQFKCREYCFQADMRLVPWVYLHVKLFTTRSCFWIKPHLFCNVSLCSNFMWNNVFPILDQCRSFLLLG